MKRLTTLIMAMAALVLAGALSAAAPDVNRPALDIKPDKTWNDGGNKKLSDFRDNYVLLVFWATW